MSFYDITQTRICAQPLTREEMQLLQNPNMPQSEKNKFRAVSMKGKIWPAKTIIYIDYVRPDVPVTINVTPEEAYAKVLYDKRGLLTGKYAGPNNEPLDKPYRNKNGNMIDQNNNPIYFDPIEKICRDKINKAKQTQDQKIVARVVKDCIKDIILKRIQPYVNLTFIFEEKRPSQDPAQIRISFNSIGGAWSVLGTDALGRKNPATATMNLGWFDASTVMHEFGHALGLCHEHQAPDSFNNKIIWNLPALYKWGTDSQGWTKETVETQVINRLKQSQVNDITFFKPGTVDRTLTDYDPFSIMLYFYPGSLTINPITGKSPGPGTVQIKRLSKKDVVYLNALYPGDGESKWYNFWKGSRISPNKFYFDTYGENITPPPKPLIAPKFAIRQQNIISDNPVGFSLLFVFIFLLLGAIIYIRLYQ